MKRNFSFLVPVLGAILVASSLRAAETPVPVKAGDRGYGLSVFRGTEATRFEVEILGTLPGSFPKGDLYLARVSGANLESTGVIAGMSGSPIFIHDRVIGALAYSWQFESEPICAITPIEAMRAMPDGDASKGAIRLPATISFTDLFASDPAAAWQASLSKTFPAPSRGGAPEGYLAEMPLSIAGASPSSVDWFGPLFRSHGLLPVTGATAGIADVSAAIPPVAGGSVAAILIGGDMSVSAVGTATDVSGSRLLAFGHPFLGLGPVEYPLASAEVIAVLPNLARSVKFGRAGREIGAVLEDRNSGLSARLGTRARTIPLDISFRTAKGATESYHYDLSRIPSMLPLLAGFATDSTVTIREKSAGESSIGFDLKVKTAAGPVEYRDKFSGVQARSKCVASIALLLSYLTANDAGGTEPESIAIEVTHDDEPRIGRIVRVDVADRVVRAGSDLHLRVSLKEERGASLTKNLTISIPPDFPAGKAALAVGDGRTLTALDLAAVPIDPRTAGDVLRAISRLHPASELRAILFRRTNGAVIQGRSYSDLPPTVLSLLPDHQGAPNDSQVGILPALETHAEMPYELEGSARIELEVKPPLV